MVIRDNARNLEDTVGSVAITARSAARRHLFIDLPIPACDPIGIQNALRNSTSASADRIAAESAANSSAERYNPLHHRQEASTAGSLPCTSARSLTSTGKRPAAIDL